MSRDDIRRRFPTASSASGPREGHRVGAGLRRAAIALLTAVVALAALGLLGPRSATAEVSTAAGTLAMEYDAVTRPGLGSEISVTVTAPRDLGRMVLAVDQTALVTLGTYRIFPEPAEQWTDGDKVVLEFETPAEEFEVTLAGRILTAHPPTRSSWQLEWRTDEQTATLEATTWVMP